MKSWYTIKALAAGEAEILIYDEIGYFGITAKDFVKDLKNLGEISALTVRINSYGGEVFDAFAIYNALQRHPATVTVIVDGIAASAASVIAMAGDKIIMPENAFMMIHRAWGIVVGNCEDMRDFADTMEKFDKAIVNTYLKKSSKSVSEIENLMAEETWLTAGEAKELGLADEISDAVKIAARATSRKFGKLPKALETPEPIPPSDPDPKPTPPPPPLDAAAIRAEAAAAARDIFEACTKAGVPDMAAEFLAQGKTVDQVRDALKDAPAIRDACAAAAKQAGIPEIKDRAAKYIKDGLGVNEVRSALSRILQSSDTEIDSKLGPDTKGASSGSVINIRKIYEDRRPQARR